MPVLPAKVPPEEYAMAAEAIGAPFSLVRAIGAKETLWNEENPADIRREPGKWRRYRFASRAAKAWDRKGNSSDRAKRWAQFVEMDAICQADALLNARAGNAAILSHSFGWCQIMGFNHQFCDYESARDWLAAMQTMQGQRECFIALVRSDAALLKAFQTRNYPVIALHYNGTNYRQNKYDTDLRDFDLAFQKEGPAYA